MPLRTARCNSDPGSVLRRTTASGSAPGGISTAIGRRHQTGETDLEGSEKGEHLHHEKREQCVRFGNTLPADMFQPPTDTARKALGGGGEKYYRDRECTVSDSNGAHHSTLQSKQEKKKIICLCLFHKFQFESSDTDRLVCQAKTKRVCLHWLSRL